MQCKGRVSNSLGRDIWGDFSGFADLRCRVGCGVSQLVVVLVAVLVAFLQIPELPGSLMKYLVCAFDSVGLEFALKELRRRGGLFKRWARCSGIAVYGFYNRG